VDIGAIVSTAVPSLSVVVAAWITQHGQHKTHAKLDSVAEEVTTINGNTLAQLGDAGEGRRAQAIPKARRTDREQHAVDHYLEVRHREDRP
jgi:hypothetical protein